MKLPKSFIAVNLSDKLAAAKYFKDEEQETAAADSGWVNERARGGKDVSQYQVLGDFYFSLLIVLCVSYIPIGHVTMGGS